MKKFVIISLILLLSFQHVLAADLMYRITHEDQDALVVGEIINEIGGSYEVEIKHIVSGNLSHKMITIPSDFQYTFSQNSPKIGDYLILSLNKRVLNYYIKWGAFKADSSDYKTLSIEKEGLTIGLQGDLAVLERYINSDGGDKDFYYTEDGVYLRKVHEEDELIFPREEATNTFNPEKLQLDITPAMKPQLKVYNYKKKIAICIMALIGLITLFFMKKKYSKRRR